MYQLHRSVAAPTHLHAGAATPETWSQRRTSGACWRPRLWFERGVNAIARLLHLL